VLPGLLQLTVLRHHRRSDEPAAVCPECGCTFGVGCSTVRPHHASATGAALASSRFQNGHPGLPVTVRYGSSVSGRRLPVGLRRRSSSAAFCHIKDVCCQTDLQQLWRQMFCSCRRESLQVDLRQADIEFHFHTMLAARLLETFCWVLTAESVAHCDQLLKLRVIVLLTYLLTRRQVIQFDAAVTILIHQTGVSMMRNCRCVSRTEGQVTTL